MKQKLFTELRMLYASSRECPNNFRMRIRMRDLIDPAALRNAVDATMKRYPYFCVELQKENGQLVFVENHRPVVISHSMRGVELNSEDSNFHMIAFCWQDNWITLDVFHGMTDGTGAYEVIRTLLYYYCSERYQVVLKDEGIRLAGDAICEEEWADPVCDAELPVPERSQLPKALNPLESAGIENDHVNTVYSIVISESEFMRFNINNDGSPATMVSLLLSRAIARVNPEATDPIRIILCVNQRKALQAPLAHQSLVGGAFLEYKDGMRSWPISKQATIYRGMVLAQTREETLRAGVSSQKGLAQLLLSKETDEERIAIAEAMTNMGKYVGSASVSYVGRANYKEAEKYIRDFRTWAFATSDLLVEISAVNGRFVLDVMQTFSDPVYVNALLAELDENGIEYDLQDVSKLEVAGIRVPWAE